MDNKKVGNDFTVCNLMKLIVYRLIRINRIKMFQCDASSVLLVVSERLCEEMC